MNSLSMFPYALVKKDSRIILYGAGNVGKDFYLQIRYSGYCTIVAWVDRKFDAISPKAPFAKVENIGEYSYDYIVIAVNDPDTAKSVRMYLESEGVDEDKIVWSPTYYAIDHSVFSLSDEKMAESPEFYLEILDSQTRVQSKYGGSGFYQSYYELGIPGTRNSGERILLYKMRDYLKKDDSVLDIGCNCGFLDLQISSFVGSVLGIEIEQGFIDVANKTRDWLNIGNASFRCMDFHDDKMNRRFNAILSLAVHELMLLKFTEQEYVDRIKELLLEGGYLFFESHDTRTDLQLFNKLCEMFKATGFTEIMKKEYVDHPSNISRIIVVMQR